VSLLAVRSIFHLTVTGLFAWSFAASGVCEARCAQAPTGFPGASPIVGGGTVADPEATGGCEHGSPPGGATGGNGDASHSSGGALACCCANAAYSAPAQARVQDARGGGVQPLIPVPESRLASVEPCRGRWFPPGAISLTASYRQHRNPPLLI
jgi:hypothetical protein